MIEITLDRDLYKPEETVKVSVRFDEMPPSGTEVKLIWFTEGKGTQDIEVIQTLSVPSDMKEFSSEFKLPSSPISFSGQLITLIWAIEVIAGRTFERKELVVSPFGREVDLGTMERN